MKNLVFIVTICFIALVLNSCQKDLGLISVESATHPFLTQGTNLTSSTFYCVHQQALDARVNRAIAALNQIETNSPGMLDILKQEYGSPMWTFYDYSISNGDSILSIPIANPNNDSIISVMHVFEEQGIVTSIQMFNKGILNTMLSIPNYQFATLANSNLDLIHRYDSYIFCRGDSVFATINPATGNITTRGCILKMSWKCKTYWVLNSIAATGGLEIRGNEYPELGHWVTKCWQHYYYDCGGNNGGGGPYLGDPSYLWKEIPGGGAHGSQNTNSHIFTFLELKFDINKFFTQYEIKGIKASEIWEKIDQICLDDEQNEATSSIFTFNECFFRALKEVIEDKLGLEDIPCLKNIQVCEMAADFLNDKNLIDGCNPNKTSDEILKEALENMSSTSCNVDALMKALGPVGSETIILDLELCPNIKCMIKKLQEYNQSSQDCGTFQWLDQSKSHIVTIKAGLIDFNGDGQTQSVDKGGHLEGTIKLNYNFCKPEADPIALVETIIHESIHGFLNAIGSEIKAQNPNIDPNAENWYVVLQEVYNGNHHEFITEALLSRVTYTLWKLNNEVGLQDYYNGLVLNGLYHGGSGSGWVNTVLTQWMQDPNINPDNLSLEEWILGALNIYKNHIKPFNELKFDCL